MGGEGGSWFGEWAGRSSSLIDPATRRRLFSRCFRSFGCTRELMVLSESEGFAPAGN